ncbi:MAG TPA: penicillin-insensitive murein endopeptidase [Psychromonas sp.]
MFTLRLLVSSTTLAITLFISNLSLATSWQSVAEPYPSLPEAIGGYNNGCLAGAQTMPIEGRGFQVIHASHNRYYGHPELIQFIKDLGVKVKRSSGKDLLIADMSMPRGGDFLSGHASHQIGLDVDLWFRQVDKSFSPAQRETPYSVNVVNQKLFKVNKNWQNAHATMIRLAAQDPRVARVFVNPAIKQQLCTMNWKNDNWLSKVRPWWGHSSHMHVRLMCPAGDNLCVNQPAPVNGNGCDEIAWWKAEMAKPNSPQETQQKQLQIKPKQCEPLLVTAN